MQTISLITTEVLFKYIGSQLLLHDVDQAAPFDNGVMTENLNQSGS